MNVKKGVFAGRFPLVKKMFLCAAGVMSFWFTCNDVIASPRDYNSTVCLPDSSEEILYNGIRLPEAWPPDTESPESITPMRVPYLENIPDIIPIDVGRQLFVDDFLIEETTLNRVFHQAEKWEGNPVFFPETEHELGERHKNKAVTYLGHGGVFYDPSAQEFKMFYTAGWRGGLALATSKDLLRWERPELGLAGENLILPPGPLMAGGDNAIWLDLNAKDSAQRYKAIIERLHGWRSNFNTRDDSPTHTLHTSADGLIWSQGITTRRAEDYSSFFYNPFREVWSYSIKKSVSGRKRFYAESKDFMRGASWENMVYWVNADSLDEPDSEIGNTPQLYSLNGIAYESIMLGQFYILLGPYNRVCEEGRFPKITELKMGFSRDGFHWDRPDRRPFIEATRDEKDFDRAYLHGTMGVCLVMGDKLWFPYTGYSGISPDGYRGMYTGASIGMATLRRDGFASMEAGKKKGILLTRPVTFRGKHLFVNVDCPDGELQVEVLDEQNRVLKQFNAKTSRPIRTDKTLQKVEWQAGDDLSDLAGTPVKFRFHLTNGKLYSFWVSPDKSGASHGYIGAGGPGYDGVIDDKGINAY
ncbi:glycosyl hydrolase family 32 [Sphingobacterium haloxyli]|uniref:Glycosyl hydrolase family 32 n=1 Tax=Sphingobacterium haloxyli TaxID=2100533 RepID=A0A2S9J7N8_9SPHI|nr:glycosyl hydrolase family 32 [Sphingobacterium haloxyli]PRD48749.1 glycosyl hydrolase family 32 [Sphingobacterium haloxyli]